MRRKLLATLLIAATTMSALTGCGSKQPAAENGSNASTTGNESAAAAGTATDAIRFMNTKIEIDKPLKAFAEKYSQETGQQVIIESLGGGVDVNGQLKNYYAAGNMPDIFAYGPDAYGSFKDWLLDISDMECLNDTDYGFKGEDGKYYGLPFAIEGYGITYNKDILDKAGVDPSAITNITKLKEAFEKIDGMKEELGLQSVCSVAAESGQMNWATGNHLMGVYLSQGLDRNDKTYIDLLKQGKIDETRMGQFADYLKLLFQYSDKNTLISGTYDDQLALWAQGKTAFITQGNWIDPSLSDYGSTFACGIMPAPFSTQDTPGILANAPTYWGVYKDSKNTEAAKKFLTALTTTADGQKALVEDCGMVSPYKSCTLEPTTPLAKSIIPYIKEGKTYAWDWLNQPEGIAQNSTGAVFELYAKEQIDKAGFIEMIGTAIADYVSTNGSN